MKSPHFVAKLVVLLLALATAVFAQVTPGGQVIPGQPLPWNAEFPGKAANVIVRGTTAQRPTNPKLGSFRFNTSLNTFEGFSGTWVNIPGSGGGGGSVTPAGQIIPTQALLGPGILIPGMNFIDAGAGGFTDNLPSAAGIAGTIINAKKTDFSATNITILPVVGQKIDGEPNIVLSEPMDEVTLVSDGSNWYLM